MRAFISGSHGLIGSELSHSLRAKGWELNRLNRPFDKTFLFKQDDVVIHLAGENINAGRWTKMKKTRIRNSRIEGTKTLARRIVQSKTKPAVFICASAIGFYGSRGNEKLSEKSAKGEGFLSDVCEEWEGATNEIAKAGIRVVNMRTAIVLSKQGGALAKMLCPLKMGLCGVIGTGRQYMSWISLEDMVRAIEFVIENETISGPTNFAAPHPVTNREFTKTLGSVLGRPTVIPIPALAVKTLFGELGRELLLCSCRVVPDKLMKTHYAFKHKHLVDALEDILK